MSEIKVAFSSKIEEQLNRLGIRKKKDFPNSEMKFYINNQESYTSPLAFSQFLWGYEWGEYEFRITQNGKLSEVKKFIEDGIDINSKFINGESVVTIAAAFDQEETLKYFLEAGVDINLCNDFGTDVFGYAEGKEGILKILNEYKEN